MKEYTKSFIVWSELAELFFETGEFADAAAAYEKAVGIEKKFTVGWANLGVSLNKVAKDKKAEASHKQDEGVHKEAKAALKEAKIAHQKAEAAHKKAIELDPEDIDLLHSLANCLCDQGKHEDAIKIEKKILEMKNATDKEKARAHNGISVSLEAKAEHDFAKKKIKGYEEALQKALEEASEAVRLDPSNILYLCNEAETLVKLGLKGDALGFIYIAASLYAVQTFEINPLAVSKAAYIVKMLTTEKSNLEKDLGLHTPADIAKFMAEFIPQHPELSDLDTSHSSGSFDSHDSSESPTTLMGDN